MNRTPSQNTDADYIIAEDWDMSIDELDTIELELVDMMRDGVQDAGYLEFED